MDSDLQVMNNNLSDYSKADGVTYLESGFLQINQYLSTSCHIDLDNHMRSTPGSDMSFLSLGMSTMVVNIDYQFDWFQNLQGNTQHVMSMRDFLP